MNIEVKNGKQQSDYPDGCIDIQAVDAHQCFDMGDVFRTLKYNGYECKHGEWAQGKFIRIPLVKKGQPIE